MAYTQEQLSKLPSNYQHPPLYRLRWRFDYNDGKRSRYGGWNSASTNPRDMAAFIDKTNLAKAIIEGEMIGSWALKPFAEIDGHRYVSCSWIMAASLPVFNAGIFKTGGSIIGMAMFTEDEQVLVFVDGKIAIRRLKPHEKKTDVMEHSIGVLI